MGVTPREQQMLDLAASGASDEEIGREMGIQPHSVHRTLTLLSWSPAADLAREAAIRRGSQALGRAVIAAGGHR